MLAWPFYDIIKTNACAHVKEKLSVENSAKTVKNRMDYILR